MADWTFLYLVEHAGSSTQVAMGLMGYNEVGGIAGNFLCSTHVHWQVLKLLIITTTNITIITINIIIIIIITRIPTAALFSILCAVSLWSLQYTTPSSSLLSYRLLLLLAGDTVHGRKTTLLPLYCWLFSQEFSETIGGIIGLNSVGAGVDSGWILQSFGWSSYLSLLSILLVVTVLLSIT